MLGAGGKAPARRLAGERGALRAQGRRLCRSPGGTRRSTARTLASMKARPPSLAGRWPARLHPNLCGRQRQGKLRVVTPSRCGGSPPRRRPGWRPFLWSRSKAAERERALTITSLAAHERSPLPSRVAALRPSPSSGARGTPTRRARMGRPCPERPITSHDARDVIAGALGATAAARLRNRGPRSTVTETTTRPRVVARSIPWSRPVPDQPTDCYALADLHGLARLDLAQHAGDFVAELPLRANVRSQ